MNVERLELGTSQRTSTVHAYLKEGGRLGLITSIDGTQLITLVLNPGEGNARVWETPIEGHQSYSSMTPLIPQCHWFERMAWDMFGLYPENHPRLKHNILHEPYDADFIPLAKPHSRLRLEGHRTYVPMEVKGDGVYEIPVGPIHAGIIEPGHFRFSCLGELVVNLEIRLGYVHRGIEKRLCEVPWQKARFVAEAAARDTVAGNALAHAEAIESLLDLEVSPRAKVLRTLSLEIERIALHVGDIGGIAGDIGYLAIAGTLSKLRGAALALAETLTDSRFQTAYILPGGVTRDLSSTAVMALQDGICHLRHELKTVLEIFLNNESAFERMRAVGKVSRSLAYDFGLVGPAGRASGVDYDARDHFVHGVYPRGTGVSKGYETNGDVLSRTKVRVSELFASLDLMSELLEEMPSGELRVALPKELPCDSIGLGIVEAHRGELIHLIFTDKRGSISRYAIKDASVNNWTALAIATRNNLVPDFPLCNKSFGLSYSGHDL